MSINFEKDKLEFMKELQKRVAKLKCPICGNSGFLLINGLFAHDIQLDLSNRQMGGLNIPTVPIACDNCGFMMEFAAGVLGALPKVNSTKPQESDNKLSDKDGK